MGEASGKSSVIKCLCGLREAALIINIILLNFTYKIAAAIFKSRESMTGAGGFTCITAQTKG
jgi:hypothetical protein